MFVFFAVVAGFVAGLAAVVVFGLEAVVPVSYTHLDVYKRQEV